MKYYHLLFISFNGLNGLKNLPKMYCRGASFNCNLCGKSYATQGIMRSNVVRVDVHG